MRSKVWMLGLGIAALAPQVAQGQEEAYTVSGRGVAIYNLAGRAEIVRGSGSEVVVHVGRGGDDAAELTVEVDRIDGMETLRVRYPDDQVVYRGLGRWGGNTTVRVARDGRFFGRRGGDRVTISGAGRGLEAWADLRIEMPAGQELQLYLAVGEVSVLNTDGDLLVDVGSADVQLREHRGTLAIDTGSGDVKVESVAGEVLIDTGSGEVELRDVDGESVDVDTGSGDIDGFGVTAETARFDTGSGGVSIEALSAPDVVVDTGSGSVWLDLMLDVDRLAVDTGSGGVTLVVPENLGADLELDSGSGGIDVDLPVRVQRTERNYLRGVIGDGRGDIEVDTGSGRIRVQGR